MSELIVANGLTKVYGPSPKSVLPLIAEGVDPGEIADRTGHTVAVSDVTFSVNAGEVFVVMGLSGSGKSTLLRMLNRLVEPTAGTVTLAGEDITALSPSALVAMRRRDMAMVFQSFALLPHRTVLENAAFGLEVVGVGRERRHARAREALAQVGLSEAVDSYPDELSGGMMQRVGLARALATEPSILLMDEAFSALDPLIRREMQEELLRLQAERQRTVIFISHDLDEAMRIGDRIAILDRGALLQVGTPREILEAPATEHVRAFFEGVDIAQVYAVTDIAEPARPRLQLGRASRAEAARKVADHGHAFAYVTDSEERYLGVLHADALAASESGLLARDDLLPDREILLPDTSVADALGLIARKPYPVPVVNREGRLLGVVSRGGLLRALERPVH